MNEYADKFVRQFGVFVVGNVLFTVCGSIAIYGVLMLFTLSPNSPPVVPKLNGMAVFILENFVFNWFAGGLLVVGFVGFVVEVRRNGLFEYEDPIETYEVQQESSKAKNSRYREEEVYDNPYEGLNTYEQLRAELKDAHESVFSVESLRGAREDGRARVQGRIQNTSANVFTDVKLRVVFLDGEGEVVDDSVTIKKRFESGEKWGFEAFGARESAELVTDFDVFIVNRELADEEEN